MVSRILIILLTCFSYSNSRVLIPLNLTTERPVSANYYLAGNRTDLMLPNGFKPQPAPIYPFQYPSATQPSIIVDTSTEDWRPMFGAYNSHYGVTTTSAPRARTVSAAGFIPHPVRQPFTPMVVLSTRTPDAVVHNESLPKNADIGSADVDEDLESMIKNQYGDLIKQILENQRAGTTRRPVQPRRRIPMRTNESVRRVGVITEVQHVNSSHPELRKQAEQINNSIELKTPQPTWHSIVGTSTRQIATSPRPPVLEESVVARTTATHIRKWPSEILTEESTITTTIAPGDSELPDSELSWLGNRNGSAITVPISMIPFNFTKMGAPFESRNSTEEPSICVPLTVRETKATGELVDEERIYCFPVPLSNEAKSLDNAKSRSGTEEANVDSVTTQATTEAASLGHSSIEYRSQSACALLSLLAVVTSCYFGAGQT